MPRNARLMMRDGIAAPRRNKREDDRWLRLMDAVGRAIAWLLALLVPVSIAGWWAAWR